LANSTIRMAFLATRPIRVTRPICAKTLFSRPRSQSARNAPRTAIGVPSSTLKGSVQLSYSAARMRKTNSSDSPKITPGETPCAAACAWKDMPE